MSSEEAFDRVVTLKVGYILMSYCGQLSSWCIRLEKRLFVAQLAYT